MRQKRLSLYNRLDLFDVNKKSRTKTQCGTYDEENKD